MQATSKAGEWFTGWGSGVVCMGRFSSVGPPKLTHTRYEAGIPAGVPVGVTVVHKTGELDGEVNDAAIISGGKGGMYVLAVMTNGPGGDSGWSLVAQISAAVWAYESAR